jgi:hypothetical protein
MATAPAPTPLRDTSLMSKLFGFTAKALPSWVRERRWGDDPTEPDHLAGLIIDKLRIEVGAEGSEVTSESAVKFERHQAFVLHRFLWHLKNFRTFGGIYAFAFTAFSIIAIASGATAASVSAGWNDKEWARWLLLGLGLAAAISAAINQLWRPAQKATNRTAGARALCEQAWAYVEDLDSYAHADRVGDAKFRKFVHQVLNTVTKAEAADAIEAAPGAPPRGGQ